MGMADVLITRKIAFDQDLMLTEKVLISLVMAEGDEGLAYDLRYLTRAMNVTNHKCDTIINGLVKSGHLSDSQDDVPLGVFVMRKLYVGPETEKVLADRKVNAVTTNEYIPVSTFENLVEDIKEEEVTP